MGNVTAIRRNSMPREEWAARIKGEWRKGVEPIFVVGADLAEARRQLSKAEYKKLWKDDLRYSKSMVSQLIKVGTSERLKKFSPLNLPPHWAILYSLTKLTDKQFTTAVDAGKIHPGMQQRDVSALRGKSRKANPSKSKHITVIDRCAMRVRSLVLQTIEDTEPDQWDELIADLRGEIDDLEKIAKQKREQQ